MIFIPKVKPNLHCMIFGHHDVCDYWGYMQCDRCGHHIYDNAEYPTLALDRRINKALHRGAIWINMMLLKVNVGPYKVRDDEIPF